MILLRIVVVGAFGAGGFLLARWWGVPDAAVPASVEAVPATAVPGQRALLEPTGTTCPDLAFVEALIVRAREEIEGVPTPFPANPAPGVSPDEFRLLLDALQDERPSLSVGRVDCDEYPCIAWVSGSDCPGVDRFSHDHYDFALVNPDGSYQDWLSIYREQPDQPEMSGEEALNFTARAVTRQRAARDAFLAESGGRAPTKLEEAVYERDQAADALDDAVDAEAIERASQLLDYAERHVAEAEKAEAAP